MATIADVKDDSPTPLTSTGETPKNRGGRPPGTGTGTRMSPDVKQALAVMAAMYDTLAAGMDFVEDEQTVKLFRAKTEALNVRNQAYFETDPKLAARIAKLGSDGGALAFFITNVTVLAPFLIPAGKKSWDLLTGLIGMFRGKEELLNNLRQEPQRETAPTIAYSSPNRNADNPLGFDVP